MALQGLCLSPRPFLSEQEKTSIEKVEKLEINLNRLHTDFQHFVGSTKEQAAQERTSQDERRRTQHDALEHYVQRCVRELQVSLSTEISDGTARHAGSLEETYRKKWVEIEDKFEFQGKKVTALEEHVHAILGDIGRLADDVKMLCEMEHTSPAQLALQGPFAALTSQPHFGALKSHGEEQHHESRLLRESSPISFDEVHVDITVPKVQRENTAPIEAQRRRHLQESQDVIASEAQRRRHLQVSQDDIALEAHIALEAQRRRHLQESQDAQRLPPIDLDLMSDVEARLAQLEGDMQKMLAFQTEHMQAQMPTHKCVAAPDWHATQFEKEQGLSSQVDYDMDGEDGEDGQPEDDVSSKPSGPSKQEEVKLVKGHLYEHVEAKPQGQHGMEAKPNEYDAKPHENNGIEEKYNSKEKYNGMHKKRTLTAQIEEKVEGEVMALKHSVGAHTTVYEQSYVLRESIWDLGLLIGMPRVGAAGSIFIGFVLLMNCGIQMLLCFIINDTFTMRSVDEEIIGEMRAWRTFAGHDFKFVDRPSYRPLVQRICTFDGSVAISTSVAQVLDMIREYLPLEEDVKEMKPYMGHILPHFEGVGVVMCICSLVIWVLNVICDLRNTLDLAWAVYELPYGDETTIRDNDSKKRSRTLVSASRQRKTFIAVILILKFWTATSICFFGSLFLVFTVSIQDLLLNAAALQLVLQLDELFYTAWVPFQAGLLLRSLKPLPLPNVRSLSGLNSWPISVSCILGILVPSIGFGLLLPQADLLAAAREEICGGNLDVVTTVDKSGVLTAVSTANGLLDDYEESYEFRAVRQLIKDAGFVTRGLEEDSLSTPGIGLHGGYFSIKSVQEEPLEVVSNFWNRGCQDILTSSSSGYANTFKMLLQDATNNRSLDRCSSVREYCSWDSLVGVRARQICPVTCGCTDPGSELAIMDIHMGCPNSCQKEKSYSNAMASRNCSDDVKGGSLLSNFIRGLREVQKSWPERLHARLDAIVASMEDTGCEAAKQPLEFRNLTSDLCSPATHDLFKPITFACPVACQCTSNNSLPLCPSKCLR